MKQSLFQHLILTWFLFQHKSYPPMSKQMIPNLFIMCWQGFVKLDLILCVCKTAVWCRTLGSVTGLLCWGCSLVQPAVLPGCFYLLLKKPILLKSCKQYFLKYNQPGKFDNKNTIIKNIKQLISSLKANLHDSKYLKAITIGSTK